MIRWIMWTTIAAAFYVAIPTGHVGVHVWMGQIQSTPQTGVTLYNPFLSSVRSVKYIQDTDMAYGIRCVSREGVGIEFGSIEIANHIRPDHVHATVTQFGFQYDTVLVLNPLGQYMREVCAQRTVDEIEITDFPLLDDLLKVDIQRQNDAVHSGITIDWVRITDVKIPPEIKLKRLELAQEKAQKLLVEERSKRISIEKSQESLIQAADNERALSATRLQAEQIHMLASANSVAAALESATFEARYRIPGYTEVLKVQALKDNLKIYFGDQLPTTWGVPLRVLDM